METLKIDKPKNGLRVLAKRSTHAFHNPMVFLRDLSIAFNASAKHKLDLQDYKACELCLHENESNEEATKLFFRPNHDEVGFENLRLVTCKRSGGITASGVTTIYPQLPRLAAFLKGDKFHRKLPLKFCDEKLLWYIELVPSMECKVYSRDKIKGVAAVYQLMSNNQIMRIGHTIDLARRIDEHKANEIPYSEVFYSPMNSVDEDARKDWERYFLDQYKKKHGVLPPYNFVNGRKIS